MTWWLWIFLGLVLLGVEILTPGGFYILFFGLGALVVGALSGLHIVEAEWLQWLLFSALSILSLIIFRGPLRRLTQTSGRRRTGGRYPDRQNGPRRGRHRA